MFAKGPLRRWLRTSNRCPLCRYMLNRSNRDDPRDDNADADDNVDDDNDADADADDNVDDDEESDDDG